MPTSTDVTTLKINTLTKAQYETAVQGGVIGANEISILTDVDEAIQVDTMPTAAAGEVGKVYQFIGTTDTNYTHGYFYECVSDGGNPATYSWTQVNVQPQGGSSLPSQSGNAGKFLTTDGTDASWATVDALPSQTGNSGKYLTTNGTSASWATVNALQNTATGQDALTIEGTPGTTQNSINVGSRSSVTGGGASFAFGVNATASGAGYRKMALGISASATSGSGLFGATAIGCDATASGGATLALGYESHTSADYAIQLGVGTNSTANTFSVGLSSNDNYRLLDSNGTIPEARLADTTSAAQGQALVLDSSLNAVWSTVESLPTQSGQSGKYLTTNGTTASWATVDALPSQTGYSGRVLGTDGFVAGWVEPEIVQRSTMPVASQDEEGNIYQFIGTTDANYTHGYFYECVASAATAACEQTYGSGLTDISVTNTATFASAFETAFDTAIGNTTVEFEYDGSAWMASAEIEGQTETAFDQDITSWAVTFTGTPQTGDTISVTYTAGSYAWAQTNVQPAPSGLPDQTGQSGKFLTTDGTDASWSDKPLVNTATGQYSLAILGQATSRREGVEIGVSSYADEHAVAVGFQAASSSGYGCCVGYKSSCSGINGDNLALGAFAKSEQRYCIALGNESKASNIGAIQIGKGTNNTVGTVSVALTTDGSSFNNYRLLDADGTIPADRLPNAINKYSSMPTAASTNVGWIVQYTGATDANYTHGYIYECVSDGGNPATYSWSAVSVQAGGGGSLPTQTGNSGKFLTTDGTDPSWATISALQNTATGSSSLTILGTATAADASINIGASSTAQGIGCLAIGNGAQVQNTYTNFSTAIGRDAKTNNACSTAIGAYSGVDSYNVGSITTVGCYARAGASETVVIGASANCSFRGTKSVTIGAEAGSFGDRGVAIGYKSNANANGAIQIGSNGSSNSPWSNSDPETLKIGNTNGNYEMMSADGTIPTDRYTTTPVADGTYVPTLTISSGVATRSWGAAASAPVVPATAPTLAVADWSSNTQTITVSGVTSSNVVLVGPAPSSVTDYASAGILCTAQGTNSLTFTCATVPSNAITLSVVIFG